jgi:hypothetical protein
MDYVIPTVKIHQFFPVAGEGSLAKKSVGDS